MYLLIPLITSYDLATKKNSHSYEISSNQAKYPNEVNLNGPQRALVSTISHGQESINRAEDLLNAKAKLPSLGNDPASYRWKETQKTTNKQSIHSQVRLLVTSLSL